MPFNLKVLREMLYVNVNYYLKVSTFSILS